MTFETVTGSPSFSCGRNFMRIAANTDWRSKPSLRICIVEIFETRPSFENVTRILTVPSSRFWRAASVYEARGLETITRFEMLSSLTGGVGRGFLSFSDESFGDESISIGVPFKSANATAFAVFEVSALPFGVKINESKKRFIAAVSPLLEAAVKI